MVKLSISRAWEEGSRFGAREFGLLFPIAFLMLALPAILINLLVPQEQSQAFSEMVEWVRRNGIGMLVLISVVIALIQLVFNTLGSLAITYLALRPGASVAESFAVARRRLLPTVAAALIVAMLSFGMLIPFWLLAGGMDPNQPPNISPGAAMGLLFALLAMMVAIVALAARLLPLTSVGAAERLGPIAMLNRSWSLTRGHFWRLLGTLILLGLAYIVISGAIAAILGLLILGTLGNPETSRSAAFVINLLGGLLTSAAAVFVLPFFARIYAQLSGDPEGTSEVFR